MGYFLACSVISLSTKIHQENYTKAAFSCHARWVPQQRSVLHCYNRPLVLANKTPQMMLRERPILEVELAFSTCKKVKNLSIPFQLENSLEIWNLKLRIRNLKLGIQKARNPIPKAWNPESKAKNSESKARNPQFRIQKRNLESKAWNPEFKARNSECKARNAWNPKIGLHALRHTDSSSNSG